VAYLKFKCRVCELEELRLKGMELIALGIEQVENTNNIADVEYLDILLHLSQYGKFERQQELYSKILDFSVTHSPPFSDCLPRFLDYTSLNRSNKLKLQ